MIRTNQWTIVARLSFPIGRIIGRSTRFLQEKRCSCCSFDD